MEFRPERSPGHHFIRNCCFELVFKRIFKRKLMHYFFGFLLMGGGTSPKKKPKNYFFEGSKMGSRGLLGAWDPQIRILRKISYRMVGSKPKLGRFLFFLNFFIFFGGGGCHPLKIFETPRKFSGGTHPLMSTPRPDRIRGFPPYCRKSLCERFPP